MVNDHTSGIVEKLLQAQEQQLVDDGSGDVVFAMFLEPHEQNTLAEKPSVFNRMVAYVVEHFQPNPTMISTYLCGFASE